MPSMKKFMEALDVVLGDYKRLQDMERSMKG
jgi:hypothetical protein